MSTKRKIILGVVLAALGGLGYGLYMYFKPAPNAGDKEVDISIKALDLYDAYVSNADTANKKYLKKTLLVQGAITSINRDKSGKNYMVSFQKEDAMFGVECLIDSTEEQKARKLEKGQQVSLQCFCNGGDGGEMATVSLNRCVIK